jgi:hypothetical protein
MEEMLNKERECNVGSVVSENLLIGSFGFDQV